jgi:hypothetical protein
MTTDGEHVLVAQARAMTGDPTQHAQVGELATRLQVQLDEALACGDPTRARELLPAVVRALSLAAQRLVGGGLVPGSAWFDQHHRLLYQKAQALFGPGQSVVPPCPTEPMPRPTSVPGQIFPRY